MSYITNEQKLNDIIFADRNKAYGAYVIRSSYGNTVFKSLSFMIISVGTIMSIAFYLNNRNAPIPEDKMTPLIEDSIYQIEVGVTPPEPEEPAGTVDPNPPADPSPVESTSVIIVNNAVEPTPTLSTEVAVNTSTAIEGPPSSTITGTGTGTKTILGDSLPDNGPRELIGVDSQPEFDGGLPALYNFIKRNLKYPQIALDEGKEGTLHVRFVVDEQGKVSRLSLRNNIGYGLDDEAIRVVSIIPNFKTPAMKDGKPVKSYYQIPIRFRLGR